MADRIKKIKYCYMKVPNRAGQGEAILGTLREEGINLHAYSGFPIGKGKAQLDFIPDDMTALRRVARANEWKLSGVKKGFLITGKDRVGAAHRHIEKLADKRINVTAADAVSAGAGRYGMLLWVRPQHYARAARVLRAK
jgi:hypothetical protein